MKLTLDELSQKLECSYIGDGKIEITGAKSIDKCGPNDITFAVSRKNMNSLTTTLKFPAVIILPENENADDINIPYIKVKSPYYTFAKVLEIFYPKKKYDEFINKTSYVSSSAKIGKNVYIDACCAIGDNVSIGDNTIIHAGVVIDENSMIGNNVEIYSKVVIRENCSIGNNVIIQPGSIIGGDGYGFTEYNGKHYKVPQIGDVIIKDNVEIGSNVTIDRATIGSTIIGEGTKIDNLVHIAHNVEIGKNCLIVAQVGISGSVIIGDNVTLAGQVGVVGHIEIGSNTTVAARAVVTGNISENSFVSGFPAKPHTEERRIKAAQRKLPELLKAFKKLNLDDDDRDNGCEY